MNKIKYCLCLIFLFFSAFLYSEQNIDKSDNVSNIEHPIKSSKFNILTQYYGFPIQAKLG